MSLVTDDAISTTEPPSFAPHNAGAIACWNDILTPKWVRFRHLLSGNGKIHSDVAYPLLPIRRGHRVLDVGCGFGETTLELAERVGPEGSALGLDCTREFLDIARREQRAAAVVNADYLLADVETAELAEAGFDAAVSRFGIMFCASPVRALRAIGRALKPGAALGLLTWRKLAQNPCWAEAERVALSHLPMPGDDSATCGPGPFAFADAETNARILEAAGFEGVQQLQIDRTICLGRTLEEAVAYQIAVGPAGYVIREAGARGEARRPAIERELRQLARRHQREDGSVWMDSSTWFITAHKPMG